LEVAYVWHTSKFTREVLDGRLLRAPSSLSYARKTERKKLSSWIGRMPLSQKGVGRDHNPGAMTAWMASAASKAGRRLERRTSSGGKPNSNGFFELIILRWIHTQPDVRPGNRGNRGKRTLPQTGTWMERAVISALTVADASSSVQNPEWEPDVEGKHDGTRYADDRSVSR
jgi:hypothetical protein